jgi:hypothetical protein
MDWYQSLSVIALTLSVGLLWEVQKIRKHIHLDDMTPTRKWKKRIEGKRYVPKHIPDQVPSGAGKRDIAFYRDTVGITKYLNAIYSETPWAFQDAGKLDGGLGSEKGAERTIEVWHNQIKTAWICLSSIDYGDRESSYVSAELDLINGRIFDGHEIHGLAHTVASLVCTTTDERQAAETSIHRTMIDAMWQVGGKFGNPSTEFLFRGRQIRKAPNLEG